MREWALRYRLKHLGIILLVTAVIELMTGPQGSGTQPTYGFTESYGERVSFFGLFPAPRAVLFLGMALIVWGITVLVILRGTQMSSWMREKTAAPRQIATMKNSRRTGMLLLLVFAILLPHIVTDPFWQGAMVEPILVYVLLAMGLNVVVGFAGLLDLGYVAFYAIGAYATAWATGSLPLAPLFHHPLNAFWTIPIGIVLAMIAGVILGAPTLRLRGDYLAIVTLGFGEIITIFANNLYGITNGSLGSRQIPHPSLDLGFFHYSWGLKSVPYYYLTLIFVVIFIIAFSMLEHSRVGRAWTAIREDEVAAESIGINPLKYKVMAFAIGASTAGFAGVITASESNVVFPSSFTLVFSINILVLVILGGMGSIPGAVLGAIVIETVTMFLFHSPPGGFAQQDLYMYLGALLITMMIVRPVGLIPSRRRKREISLAEEGEGHASEVLTGDVP